MSILHECFEDTLTILPTRKRQVFPETKRDLFSFDVFHRAQLNPSNYVDRAVMDTIPGINGKQIFLLHVAPASVELPLGVVRYELSKLQYQLRQCPIGIPSYVVGVSYLAKYAKRFGFRTHRIETETLGILERLEARMYAWRVRKLMEKNFDASRAEKKSKRVTERDLHICWIPTEEFLAKNFE